MTDYIREAVRLAGWLKEDDLGEYLEIPDSPVSGYLDTITIKFDQYLFDALAAQLVRQVDDSEFAYVVIHQTETRAFDDENESLAEGPDRTMNSIKAIVDSGVLE